METGFQFIVLEQTSSVLKNNQQTDKSRLKNAKTIGARK
jgi:hypothetical protein